MTQALGYLCGCRFVRDCSQLVSGHCVLLPPGLPISSDDHLQAIQTSPDSVWLVLSNGSPACTLLARPSAAFTILTHLEWLATCWLTPSSSTVM